MSKVSKSQKFTDDWRQASLVNISTNKHNTEWHKKNGTFEKPNKNLRNPKKKKILTEIQPLQLAF